MKIEIIDANASHVRYVLQHSAVAAAPKATKRMLDALKISEIAKVGLIDHEPVAVWGLTRLTLISDRVYIWLLSKENIDTPFVFVRYSQMVVNDLLTRYPIIIGHVAAESPMSQRWLRLLGFKIVQRTAPLYEIERRA